MLERQLVVPVPPARLWEVLTDPDSVAGWFGARVEWDLRPGGRARFRQDEGPDRLGRVDEVSPGRHLVFRWWPDGDEEQASEVSYRLEPDDDGTRLTVTERPVPAEPARIRDAGAPPASACAGSGHPSRSDGSARWSGSAGWCGLDESGGWAGSAGWGGSGGSARWSRWDSRLVGMWARATGPALVGAGSPAARW